jgi:hypothetical protein
MNYRGTIERLARENDATIRYERKQAAYGRKGARSTPHTRELFLPRWGDTPDEEQFWTALHELGHIVLQHVGTGMLEMFGKKDLIIEQESDAWRWALDNAGVPLDDEGRANVAQSLASYQYSFGPALTPTFVNVAKEVGADVDYGIVRRLDPKHSDLVKEVWSTVAPVALAA